MSLTPNGLLQLDAQGRTRSSNVLTFSPELANTVALRVLDVVNAARPAVKMTNANVLFFGDDEFDTTVQIFGFAQSIRLTDGEIDYGSGAHTFFSDYAFTQFVLVISDSGIILAPDKYINIDSMFNVLGYDSGTGITKIGPVGEDRDTDIGSWVNKISLRDGEIDFKSNIFNFYDPSDNLMMSIASDTITAVVTGASFVMTNDLITLSTGTVELLVDTLHLTQTDPQIVSDTTLTVVFGGAFYVTGGGLIQIDTGTDADLTLIAWANFIKITDGTIQLGASDIVDGIQESITTGPRPALKTADESRTSTTVLANDATLVASLTGGYSYRFSIVAFATNAGALAGIKVALGGTATVTDLKAQVKITDDVTNAVVAFARLTALGSGSVGVGLSTGDSLIEIVGTMSCTVSGTITFQWAQNTSNGSATTVQKASFMTNQRFT